MGYRLNRLDEPVFIAVLKPLLTEFGIHLRLESCDPGSQLEISYFLFKMFGGVTRRLRFSFKGQGLTTS